MSKAVTRGAAAALAMARDAFGNLISGNDERALRFLIEQIKLLEATVALSGSKNGVREDAALNKLMQQQVTMENDWPKFSGDKLQEQFQHWNSKGIASSMGLIDTPVADLGAAVAAGGAA